MQRLRDRILELGGMQAANSYVRVNLSLFGLYPARACPSIPPEIILLPFNFIYQMSSWTRAIVIALSIVHAANPQSPGSGRLHARRTVSCRRADASGARRQYFQLAQLASWRSIAS